MNKVMIDTNAYSALMVGDTAVLKVIDDAETVLVSPIVIGELLAGFSSGNRMEMNRNILDEFLSQSQVQVPKITSATSEWFGKIFAKLRQSGTPIPTNDIWIAAQAQENGSEIVSYDQHFDLIAGLLLWKKPRFN